MNAYYSFYGVNTALELGSILGRRNKSKCSIAKAVTIRVEAIARCQHYCFYSAGDNLHRTEML